MGMMGGPKNAYKIPAVEPTKGITAKESAFGKKSDGENGQVVGDLVISSESIVIAPLAPDYIGIFGAYLGVNNPLYYWAAVSIAVVSLGGIGYMFYVLAGLIHLERRVGKRNDNRHSTLERGVEIEKI